MSKQFNPSELESMRRAARRAKRQGDFEHIGPALDARAQLEGYPSWAMLMHAQLDNSTPAPSASRNHVKSVINTLAPHSGYPVINGEMLNLGGLDLHPSLPVEYEKELYDFLELALVRSSMYSNVLLDAREGFPIWLPRVLRRFAGLGLAFEIYPAPIVGSHIAKVLREARGGNMFSVLHAMSNAAIVEFLNEVPTFVVSEAAVPEALRSGVKATLEPITPCAKCNSPLIDACSHPGTAYMQCAKCGQMGPHARVVNNSGRREDRAILADAIRAWNRQNSKEV